MTTEQATMVLRRKPQTDWERGLAADAVRTLALAGVSAREAEIEIMRPLEAEELAVLNAAR